MNTKVIIGLIVAVVVIGGGAWYFTSHPGGVPGAVESNGEAKGESGTLSFKELMLMGGSRQCEVTVMTPDSPATGTVYVSGDNVRSDIVAKPSSMNGGSVSAHMIKSGDYIYSWTDMVPQGVKMKVTATETEGSKAGYDANAEVKYSCSVWVPDAGKFAVPEAITFMDFSTGAPGMMPTNGGTMPTPPPGMPNNY